MKIEHNMYVRTKAGLIFKIEKYLNRENNIQLFYKECKVKTIKNIDEIKASHNIIDLIEVGDVITTNNLCGQVTCIEGDKIYTTCYDGECCYDYQIQSIVTKEQFSSMEYRLGE